MKRGIGVGAVHKKTQNTIAFSKIGLISKDSKLSYIKSALKNFKDSIDEFSIKHKQRINEDPEFRHQFHKMCSAIKVDPLASNKGFKSR
jgi:ESCRT-II complex subunit VPS22